MTSLVGRLTGLPGTSLATYVTARRVVTSWTCGGPDDGPGGGDPRGRGPVVLVGGFCTTDRVLEPMRCRLQHLGYDVLTHTLNGGMGCGSASVEQLRETVRRAARLDRHGDGVHVVGYSRGGQFARILAADPGSGVRSLVTLGSPFDLYRLGPVVVVPALAVVAAGTLGLPNMASSACLLGACCAEYRQRLRDPLPVPFTSIYSRGDRLVPWRSSVDDSADNVELEGSHLDLVESVAARSAVARALARNSASGDRPARRARVAA